MISKNVTVVNPSGLHLRPAGVLTQTAMKFKSDITIQCGEKKITAKSVLNVMAAGIKCGTEITLICDGADEEEAMKTLSEAIESGLGEMKEIGQEMPDKASPFLPGGGGGDAFFECGWRRAVHRKLMSEAPA